jgi:hypothetical protein
MDNKQIARRLVVLIGFASVAVFGSPSARAEGKTASAGTVSEAVKAVDLTKLPLVEGADPPVKQSIGKLTYTIPGDVRVEAFAFHREQLLKDGWTQEQNRSNIVGTFRKDGYAVTLSTSTYQAGHVTVKMENHGNVDLAKLPMPSGSKELAFTAESAKFLTITVPEVTKKAFAKSLSAKGWQPYGAEKDVLYFKQNAIRLAARIYPHEQLKGRTLIDIKPELLEHDLPAPLDATDLKYDDVAGKLTFDTKSKPDAVAQFYTKELTKKGWKAGAKTLTKATAGQTMKFQNREEAPLTLLVSITGAATHVELQHELPKDGTGS